MEHLRNIGIKKNTKIIKFKPWCFTIFKSTLKLSFQLLLDRFIWKLLTESGEKSWRTTVIQRSLFCENTAVIADHTYWHRRNNCLSKDDSCDELISSDLYGNNRLLRVPNRFFGIRDLAYFKAGIRDFEGKGGRDSGLQLWFGNFRDWNMQVRTA